MASSPAVDHFAAARAVDVAGIDIYHPTQDHLTGAEIAFGGDLARSMRAGQNYLVIETQAQGFPEWTPYPGQLRLQAFSHLASGANMVEYWHWGTTANAIETYWRGLLSQDFKPNPTYDEAGSIGKDFARLGPQLVNMRKQNRIAIYVSNRALTAFNAFKFGWTSKTTYNDVLRPFYDALYRMNAEVDFVDPSTDRSFRLQADHRTCTLRCIRRGDRAAECLCQGGRSFALHLQEWLLRRECTGTLQHPAGPDRRGRRREVQPVHHPRRRLS